MIMIGKLARSGWISGLLFCGVLGAWTGAFAQQPLLNEIRTIATDSEPVEKSFEIPADGEYTLTLTDFAFPEGLDAIRLAVTRGSTVVTTLSAPAVNQRFTTTAGTHVLRVVGIPSSSGSFGVEVKAVSGSSTPLQFAGALGLTTQAVDGRGLVASTFTTPAAGNYTVKLSDLQLPRALETLTLAITRPGSPDVFTMTAAGTQTFALQAGEYRIYAVGQAVAGETAGLFAVDVRAASTSAIVFTQAMPIGEVVSLGTATTGAGAHTLTLTDFAFPVALTLSGAVIARDSTVAARLPTPGDISFTASAGSYSIYGYAVAAPTPASGSFGVELRPQGGAAVFSAAKTVGGTVGGTPAYAFPIDISTPGVYRARLTDFELPAPLAPASLAATQAGALIGTLSSPGSLDLNLAAGKLFLLVIAKPSAGQGALFGVDLAPASGGDPVFEITQGVGALFSARKVTVTTAGTYTVSITDLAFPKRFTDLSAVVTRGAERKGSIFGGGSFNFSATPGSYFINFIAQGAVLDETKSPTQKAGTYAMTADVAVPAPSITLTANPSQVRSGESVELQWATQNATACTASGGWSGSKSMQGSERSAALTASASYKLTCTGPGGNSDQSVSVAIVASASGGGGGMIEWLTLFMLVAAIRLSSKRRA